jgi:hypothetical protein
LLHGNQRVERSDPRSQPPEVHLDGSDGKFGITRRPAGRSQDVERAGISFEREGVTGPERSRIEPKWEGRVVTPNPKSRVELAQSGNQADEVLLLARISDIEVEGRRRRAVQSGRDPTNDDVVDTLPVELGQDSMRRKRRRQAHRGRAGPV